MSDQRDEQIQKLTKEVSDLRQYKIDTARKVDSLTEKVEGFDQHRKEQQQLREMYADLQKEFSALQKDKSRVERGILDLIKRLADDS